jgi:D-alanyl-D-alanine dipeptidase
VDSTRWVELHPEDGFEFDLRYATSNNFLGHIIYDCGRCFLRPDAAKALNAINRELRTQGYKVKLFDCYRPLSVQWELWEELPDPNYVADPKKGSMHNRGQAVDLTLVNIETGDELNMGTDFDFFGPKAYHSETKNLSIEIQENRSLLKNTMIKHDFYPIRTEWWHYSRRDKTWPLFEKKWDCVDSNRN